MNTPPTTNDFPRTERMISAPLYPNVKKQSTACPHCQGAVDYTIPIPNDVPITWVVGQPHALVPDQRVVAMYPAESGFDVYSLSNDGKSGLRTFVPMQTIRLTADIMPRAIFDEELRIAETGEEEEEPEDDEPEQSPAAQMTTPSAS